MRLWAEPRPVLQVGTVGSISLQSIDRQTRRTTDAGNESWHWRRREKGEWTEGGEEAGARSASASSLLRWAMAWSAMG